MSVEVKQLKINSVFQREAEDKHSNEGSDCDDSLNKAYDNKADTQSNAFYDDLSQQVEEVKADVLAACKRLIHKALVDRQSR